MLEFRIEANVANQTYDIHRYFRKRFQKVQQVIPVEYFDVKTKDGGMRKCTKKQAWEAAKIKAEEAVRHLNRKKWRDAHRKRERDHEIIKQTKSK